MPGRHSIGISLGSRTPGGHPSSLLVPDGAWLDLDPGGEHRLAYPDALPPGVGGSLDTLGVTLAPATGQTRTRGCGSAVVA